MNDGIRQAGQHDAEAIARIHVLAWQVAYAGIIPDHILKELSLEQRTGRWRARISKGAEQIMVAEEAGQVAGFCSYGDAQDEDKRASRAGEIYTIYVDPPHWRRGVGGHLLRQAHDFLGLRGAQEIILWVFEANAASRRFYEAHGYRSDGTRKRHSDSLDIPVIRYAKSIAPG